MNLVLASAIFLKIFNFWLVLTPSCLTIGYTKGLMSVTSTTRDSIYNHYITVGYKGKGVEAINNVVLLDNAELTAMLTLEIFTAETELPAAKTKDEFFALLRPQ